MHGREACMAGGMHGRGACVAGRSMWWGGVWQGGVRGRRDGHCSRWYASYWNAFLLWKNIPFPYWCIYVVKQVKPVIEKNTWKVSIQSERFYQDILCVSQTSLQFIRDSWSNVTDFAAISSGNGFQGATQTTNTETFCWWNMMKPVVLIQNETLTTTKAF